MAVKGNATTGANLPPYQRRAACAAGQPGGRRNWPACRPAHARSTSAPRRTAEPDGAATSRPASNRHPPPGRIPHRRFPRREMPLAASAGSHRVCRSRSSATRRRGKRRNARCMRTPRSPLPCGICRTRNGRQRARSGVIASTVRNRLSAISERSKRLIVAMWKRSAARAPMSRARRRFTAPRRGARANTITVSFMRRAARSVVAARRRNTKSGTAGCATSGDTSPDGATSRLT